MSKADAVGEVAQGTAENQPQSHCAQDAGLGEIAIEQQDYHQPDYGNERQQESLVGEQAEC